MVTADVILRVLEVEEDDDISMRDHSLQAAEGPGQTEMTRFSSHA